MTDSENGEVFDPTGDLVEKALKGDSEAITALYNMYEGQLKNAVGRHLGENLRTQLETADLIQSVWKDVLDDMDGFEYQGPDSFFRWLLKRMIHKIQSKGRYYARAKRNLKKRIHLSVDDSRVEGGPLPASPDPQPSEAAIDQERLDRLASILDTFPTLQREVLMLRMREEMEYEAISRIIGKSPESTRKIFGRSLEKLLELMKEDRPGQESAGR